MLNSTDAATGIGGHADIRELYVIHRDGKTFLFWHNEFDPGTGDIGIVHYKETSALTLDGKDYTDNVKIRHAEKIAKALQDRIPAGPADTVAKYMIQDAWRQAAQVALAHTEPENL